MMDGQAAMTLLAGADLIHSAEAVAAAVSRVAREISSRLHASQPLVLCVMKGGVPFAGQLLTQLTFPLDFDYLDVSRYGQATAGGALSWRVEPSLAVAGRTLLVVDDILDEGITLAAIRDRLLANGGGGLLYGRSRRQVKWPKEAPARRLRRPDRSRSLRFWLRHGRPRRVAQSAGDLRHAGGLRCWQSSVAAV
jgi:hypothetical protein